MSYWIIAWSQLDEIQMLLVYWSFTMMHLSNDIVLNQVSWYIYNMIMNWILLVSWPVKICTTLAFKVILHMNLISLIQNHQFWPFSNRVGIIKNRYLAVKAKKMEGQDILTILIQFEYSCHATGITTETSLNRIIWIFIYYRVLIFIQITFHAN